MAKECANFVRFGATTGAAAPAYITNDLVTVTTGCSSSGGVFETRKTQNPGAGDLCVNDPAAAGDSKCEFTVDGNGGMTGLWS